MKDNIINNQAVMTDINTFADCPICCSDYDALALYMHALTQRLNQIAVSVQTDTQLVNIRVIHTMLVGYT
jgi:hypothetical protein